MTTGKELPRIGRYGNSTLRPSPNYETIRLHNDDDDDDDDDYDDDDDDDDDDYDDDDDERAYNVQ